MIMGLVTRLKLHFNPRTHEECDVHEHRQAREEENFNPRTHEECDIAVTFVDDIGSISIHALTRSATKAYGFWASKTPISIHALTRSATDGRIVTLNDQTISIHALTRSATNPSRTRSTRSPDFNPRTHEECDVPVSV
ncbi:Hypothetical protein TR210_670 [Trichococcus ilyis]|uniref:Uncharacterized protein n=1 Tax=Trichococcus ilyis TaxID=640938 RepID=A0A143YDG8_9LACT|nr:Hypothetical protein TR210_670 [Trichococcus ilyis]